MDNKYCFLLPNQPCTYKQEARGCGLSTADPSGCLCNIRRHWHRGMINQPLVLNMSSMLGTSVVERFKNLVAQFLFMNKRQPTGDQLRLWHICFSVKCETVSCHHLITTSPQPWIHHYHCGPLLHRNGAFSWLSSAAVCVAVSPSQKHSARLRNVVLLWVKEDLMRSIGAHGQLHWLCDWTPTETNGK